jgi:uroporphyrinogen decarboxylase
MDSRERILTVLEGGIPDRVPLDDGYWTTTVERWRREGLPADVSPYDYFGTNEIVFIGGDYTMQFPERVLAEGEAVRHYWDSDGALRKDLHVEEGWTSQWLDFTIKGPDDWLEHRHRLTYNDSRISSGALETYERARAAGRFVCYGAHACFHPTWARIGMENMLMLMLDDPGFIHEMYAAHAEVVIGIFEGLRQLGIEFDGARLADDLGYRVAPLISPKLYRELVYPHHKRLCDHFAEYGLKTMLHSDGNIAPLIPHFLEAGFGALHPLEVKAGLDIRELAGTYGDRLVFYGNIDVRKLSGSKQEIEQEVTSKLAAVKETGGYIYHSDHSVPNSVSFENYAFAIELIRQYGTYGA